MAGPGRSIEKTPTWAVAVVFVAFLVVSYMIEITLHYLAQLRMLKKRKSLKRALDNIKTEMMKLGFVSLMLTITEVPISRICVNRSLANSFLPCEDQEKSDELGVSSDYCGGKEMVPLLSIGGVKELNIFITVLAVFHVLYCLSTMFLGMAKMRKWEAWEEETHSLQYKIRNDPRRFQATHKTPFGQRHLQFWSDHQILLWIVCFFRQFNASVTKADYYTLRNGFIAANMAEGSNFNFQKFIARAYDDDFEHVVGIRFWIWIFSILFIFFSAHDFYNHYWLPIIPLAVALVVGTKLEVTITKMCLDSHNKNYIIRGTMPVKPRDDLFWFGRPEWLLHLLQLILVQNSFQLAFFAWTWFKYGLRSCFNRETEDIVIRIVMGVVAQFLCGYVTLPLYALVSQMGSGMRKAIFSDRVIRGLKNWHDCTKRSLLDSKSTSRLPSPNESRRYSVDASTMESILDNRNIPSVMSSSTEIMEEKLVSKNTTSTATNNLTSQGTKQQPNPRMIRKTMDDGEFSFGRISGDDEIANINLIIKECTIGKTI